MTVDHFPANPLLRISNSNFGLFGFFTAALGFVFLSGYISGRVYEESRARFGFGSMTARIMRRVRALYVTQGILYVVLAVAIALGLTGAGRWNLDLFENDPLTGVLFSFSLLYEPGYLGILPMYCLFLLATPALLWQFQRGRSWQILGGSFVIWIAAGLLIELPANPGGIDFGAFDPLTYQLLFVVGLAFGAGRLRLDRLTPKMTRWAFVVAAAVASTFFVLRLLYALDGPINPLIDRFGMAFSVVQLGPLRLLDFAAFGLLVYFVCQRIRWDEIDNVAFRWLAFIGCHSLPVFAWSILVTYAAVALLPAHTSAWIGLVGVVVAAASLQIPATLRAAASRRQTELIGIAPAEGLAARRAAA